MGQAALRGGVAQRYRSGGARGARSAGGGGSSARRRLGVRPLALATVLVCLAGGLGVQRADADTTPSLSIADASVVEGSGAAVNVTVTVRATMASPFTMTVNFLTGAGTASSPGDFTAQSGSLAFPPGTTTRTITVAVAGDLRSEGNEYFQIFLNSPLGATISDNLSAVTIWDDEIAASLDVGNARVTEGDSGTNNAVFPVTLSSPAASTVRVRYHTGSSSASETSDFTPTAGTAVFAPGETAVPVSVPVRGDVTQEANEDFYLYLSAPQGAVIAASGGSGRGYIVDDDAQAYLRVGDARVTEGNAGTVDAAFTVSLLAPSTRTVKVNAFTSDSGASAAGNDYTQTSVTLTFPPGTTSQTVSVPVKGDTADEPASEAFLLNLSSPIGAVVLNSSGTGTIVDDDPSLSLVAPSIVVEDAQVVEPDSGQTNVTVTLRMTPPATAAASVNWSTGDSSAGNPGDYTAGSGTVAWTAGQSTRTFTVAVKGDTVDEANEAFVVNLASPSGASISDSQGQVVILDNDVDPTLSLSSPSVAEGASGTTNATFQLTLSSASVNTVSVNFATVDSSAAQPADYTSTTGSVVFSPGQTTRTVSVPVKGDLLRESNESFSLNLSNPANVILLDGSNSAMIANDDRDEVISVADASAFEGQSGTSAMKFTVMLAAPSAATVSVNYATSDSSASAGSDYVTTSGTITFAPGVTTQTFNVTVNGDAVDETTEQFVVNFSSPVNGSLADTQALGIIYDDDTRPLLSLADARVTEGAAGTKTAAFAVTLSQASAIATSVNFSTGDGSATVADADYVAASGTLNFAAGEVAKTISVTLNGDVKVEADETFSVSLSSAVNATLLDSTAVGLIANDDQPVALLVDSPTVTEGNTGTKLLTFSVGLSTASAATVSVNYSTGDSSASAGSDYVATSGALTFTPGQTAKTVAVTVNGDTTNEANEVLVLNLSSAVNAVLPTSSVPGVILDDDPVKAPTYLVVSDAGAVEGDSGTANATFTVTLSPPSASTVLVYYATSGGSAEADVDFVSASGSLAFAPGQTTKTVVVEVTGDVRPENDETFGLNLSGAVGASVLRNGTGIIPRNDATPAIWIGDASVVEGNTLTATAKVAISMSPSASPLTVNWSTSGSSAVEDDDFEGSANSVVFAPGETTKFVSIPVFSDDIDESDETFSVNLALAPGNVGTFLDSSGDVQIRDDDTFTVGGAVTNGALVALPGVTITLSGNNFPDKVVTTNASGVFTLVNVTDGSYVVTPTAGGTTFVPASSNVTVRGGDVSGLAFIGVTGAALGGRVTNSAGSALAGVVVNRTGNAQPSVAATTNALGYYAFANSPVGTYTLTATPGAVPGTSFTPPTYSVPLTAAGVTNNDFVGTTGVAITGRVVNAGGAGVSGVTITRSGGGQPTATVRTNARGYYGFSDVVGTVAGTTYTLTPSATGATFTPASRTATVTNTTGASGADFTRN